MSTPAAGFPGAHAATVEQRVLAILGRYVSALNARVVLERGRRAPPPGQEIREAVLPQLCTAIESSARLFVAEHRLQEMLRAIAELGPVPAQATDQRIVRIDNEDDVRVARLTARDLAAALGARSLVQQRIATSTSELARNICSYTSGGTITFSPRDESPRRLVIVAEDQGPGIPNLADILAGNYRSRTGLGRGLLGVQRLMELFDVRTSPRGTRIEVESLLA